MKNYLALITQKRALIIVIVVLIVGSLTASIFSKDEEEDKAEPRTKTVAIETIQRQDTVTTELIVSGTAVPREYSSIKSLTQGTVEFLVPVGVDIVRGQSLFSIRDANVESAYFNSLDDLNSTQASADQQISQAELALSSKLAAFEFAKKTLDSEIRQSEQRLKNAQNTAIVSYNSSYNTLTQALLSVSAGALNSQSQYIYKNVLTTNSALRGEAITQFSKAVGAYNTLPEAPSIDMLSSDLNTLQVVLEDVKNLIDMTVIILQNSVSENDVNDLSSIQTQQVAINTSITSILTNSNALSTVIIDNDFKIEQAENRLELSNIEYDNTLIALDNAKITTRIQTVSTQSRFDIAAYNFSNLTLVSPFNGTVLAHNVNVGEQVSIGQELVEIGNLDIIEIKVDIDAAFANALEVRDPVVINENVPGFIAEIEPVADIRSGKVGITVQSREGVLITGDIAHVLFDLIFETPESVIIPIKAATIEEVKTVVFIEEEGKAKERIVTLGEIYGDKVRVTSGLTEGDRLIIPNGTFISENDTVIEAAQ